MRIMGTMQPLESHLRAIQQMIRTLRLLDHDACVAAPDTMAELLASYGLAHLSAGEDWTVTPDLSTILGDTLTLHGNESFIRTVIEKCLAGPSAASKATDVEDLADRWKPNGIFCDITDFGGRVAAAGRYPLVLLDNGWARPLFEQQECLIECLSTLFDSETAERQRTGNHPILTPCPPELIYPDLLTPDKPYLIGYRVEHPQRIGERLPEWAGNLRTDRPLVYGSFGSIFTCSTGFSNMINSFHARVIEALNRIECTAILSVGRSNVNALRPLAAGHVRIVPFVAQPLMLHIGVDALLMAGGLGTVKEQLTSGVPPVVFPISSEHFWIARRYTDLGLGIGLQSTATADEIEQSVREVLSNPQYRQTSLQWRRRTLALRPLESVLGDVLADVLRQ